MQKKLKFGRSLNPPAIAINVGDLLDEMYIFNKDRRQRGKIELSHSEYIKFVYGMNVFDWLRRSVDPLEYYLRFAKFGNQVNVRYTWPDFIKNCGGELTSAQRRKFIRVMRK